jgi:hypothetical protein
MWFKHVPSKHVFKRVSAHTLLSKSANTRFGFDESFRVSFLNQLEEVGIHEVENYSIEEAERIRESLLKLGRPLNHRVKGNPSQLLEGIKTNGVLLCGELAELYGYSLFALGFQIRLMHFSRSIFDPWDRHATVEVWDQTRNKWIVSDPTFNVSFVYKNQYLSLIDLYNFAHSPASEKVITKKGVKVPYAVDLNDYYISFYSLLDNVFYESNVYLSGVSRYPPLRLFDERRFIGLVSSLDYPVRSGEIYIQNTIVYWVFGVGPLLILIAGSLIVRCAVIGGSAPPLDKKPTGET